MRRMNIISFKRKLSHKTDYRRRMRLLASNVPRLVVRKSLNNIYAQVINFDSKGDKVIAAADSRELKHLGWNFHTGNLPSAYLTGLIIGKKAQKHSVKKVILDIGLARSVPGSSQYALLKGALDSGLEIPHSQDMIPNDERIQGSHIVSYAKHSKTHQFSRYKKENIHVDNMPKLLEEIKSKIIKEHEHAKKAK